MPKANKEFVLNYAFNRWQLGYPRNVGHLSKSIRELSPKSKSGWETFYFKNLRSKQHLDTLGRKLYDKIKNVVAHEERFHPKLIESITLHDCLDYVYDVVINRTYDGFRREFG